jgi:hypothetical protein
MDALADTLSALQELLPSRCRCVSSALAMQPQWFQSMVTGAAIDEFEGTYGFHFSESLRLFYRYPAYAVFLRCHHDTTVFLDESIGLTPSLTWTKTSYPPWLAIADSADTGQFLMVQLDRPRPQIAWRQLHTLEHCCLLPWSFDDWLMQGARKSLKAYHEDGDCSLCQQRGASRRA